jgi:hypothetical protein
MKLSFTLVDADLQHYRQVMQGVGTAARNLQESSILQSARTVLAQAESANPVQFLALRFASLRLLIEMLADAQWNLVGEDRERVFNALAYFSNPGEMLPDSSTRFLDAAIMVELICRDLKHELSAYEAFCSYRDKRGQASHNESQQRAFDQQRERLQARMHQRRQREMSSPASRWRQLFSLLGM